MASSIDAGCMGDTIRAQRLRGVTTTEKSSERVCTAARSAHHARHRIRSSSAAWNVARTAVRLETMTCATAG